ncbi:S-layer homology domain-containing protein [Pseudoflavonifractor sp. MSJ-37]|uniref:S-layer homology domain-containing protein n=1 Tax=Pseudoflavonifractor sp. MSJ-37 TaxID=2841531 RepID=UPI001C1240F9|nr:S-layer homology domain-containing protein [Pseudoflavonifractor sp. MSJ-37]MBU5436330.1 S-layer homology domain-containing protein [Pseudoflavonifractor sp. MSJ-37]
MSNLKKVLSVGLASTMVLGMMTTAGAANYDKFADKDQIVNKEAVSMVSELGIIAGLTDGTYAPKQNIDRASFARLVCVALNGGTEPKLGALKTTFSDTQGNWAEKYIAYCVQQGIISGKGNNTFAPSANVTGSEAAKMLLVALGYNCSYENIGGANWQTATDVLANQAGLYDDLESMNTSAPLTRDNAAQMVYNALNATKVKYEMVTGVSANGQITVTPQRVNVTKTVNNSTHDVTMLEDAFNAVKVEGVVVANEYADLESATGSSLSDGKTRIEITNGVKGDNEQSAFDGSATFSVSTGLDQLGRTVNLYVKDDNSSSSKAKVLGNVIITDDNKVVTDASDDSIKTVADDNDLTVGKNTKVAENYAEADAPSNWDAKGTNGVQKVLIDNDNDDKVDYVLLNTFNFGKVTTYVSSGDGSIVVNAGDTKFTANDKDDVKGFDNVKKDDYVLAALIGGDLYVEKAESVSGTLESYKYSGEVATKITVAGTTYNVSTVEGYTGGDDDVRAASVKADVDSALKGDATFYLDKNGYIVAMADTEETASNYALVLAKDSANGIDTRVKVALSDGTTGTYNLNDKGDVKKASDAVVGRVYSYSINSNKEIKLDNAYGKQSDGKTSKTTEAYAFTNAGFEKNKTAVKYNTLSSDDIATADYTSTNTAFFYVSAKGGTYTNFNSSSTSAGSIGTDDVDVYTGYTKAPDVKSTSAVDGNVKAYVYTNSNDTRVVAVVFVGSKVATASQEDNLYVTKIDNAGYDGDTTTVKAFVSGSAELQTIKVNDDVSKETAYTWSRDSDGNYDLDDITDNVSGTIDRVSGKVFVLNNGTSKNEYKITADTLVVDDSEDLSDATAEMGGTVSKDDVVAYLLANSDNEAQLIVIKNGKTGSEDTSATATVLKGNGADLNKVYTDLSVTDSVLKTSLKDGMKDITVSAKGETVVLSGTIGYTTGFTAFNSSAIDEQSGYYAILRIQVPDELKDVVKYSFKKGDSYTAAAELDGSNYFILVQRLNGDTAPKAMEINWLKADGTTVVGTSTVKFDVSGLEYGL